MTDKRTILLTGGTGFLGSNLLQKLVLENFNIILLKRSTSNTTQINNVLDKVIMYDIDKIGMDRVFQNNHVDIIIHCATNYGRKDIDPIELLEANIILPLRLLQFGNEGGAFCFINTDTILDKRINYYSLSKSQFKEWLKVYSNNMACINISLEHFYGPYDDKTKFVTYIIHKILNNVDDINLTKGKQKRDFIYIDDVTSAFLKIINHSNSLGKGFYNYEIGTTHATAIRDIVVLIKRLAKNSHTYLNFGTLPYRKNEVMEYRVDISETLKLGWKAEFSLEEGLKKTIDLEKERLGI